jgi:hypothetical protein
MGRILIVKKKIDYWVSYRVEKHAKHVSVLDIETYNYIKLCHFLKYY